MTFIKWLRRAHSIRKAISVFRQRDEIGKLREAYLIQCDSTYVNVLDVDFRDATIEKTRLLEGKHSLEQVIAKDSI